MNDVLSIVVGALATVLTALVTWGVERLITYINRKIQNERAAALLTDALSLVTTVVKQTYQTYVKAIKGTEQWTKQAQEEALANALELTEKLMSEEIKSFITQNYGELETWLVCAIEAKILDLKRFGSS